MTPLFLVVFFAVEDRSVMHPSIDGNWAVLCLERDGQPVPNARNVTVHVKDNVVTFKCPDGTPEKDKVRAMRVEFGRWGTLRVTEANADGKFEIIDPQPIPGTAANPTGAVRHLHKTGVYVLTHDYLAICLHEGPTHRESASTGTVQLAGGTNQPVVTADIKPIVKSHCSVILKRIDTSNP
jgi:hypothetical protein